jgi:TAP-like protein
VIGTEFDPLTPGLHAAEFAGALDDAVHVIWEGVGHTAFPASSFCIDGIVTDQFLDGPVAEDGLRCPFVDGVTDDAELADDLFVHDRGIAANWVGNVLETRGEDPDVATCMGREVATTDDSTISHVILGVTSDEAVDALAAARAAC